MGVEYEAKFLDINVKEMREKLKSLGADIIHKKKLYKRAAYNLCKETVRGYTRVRKENDKVTMTTKIFDSKYPQEYEITINNTFKEGVAFLSSLGINKTAYQETLREKWKHPLAHEITFDTLPGIPTYMEVDCESEENLEKLIKMLGLDITKKRYGSFDKTYLEYYGIPCNDINNNIPLLTFENIDTQIHPTKNIDLFNKMAIKHKKMAQKWKRKS